MVGLEMRDPVNILWVGIVRYETLVIAPISLSALVSLFWHLSPGAAAFGILGTAYSLRALRVGVSVDHRGMLIIRGFIGSRRIPCASVRGIEHVPAGPSAGVGLRARTLILEITSELGSETVDVSQITCNPKQMDAICYRLKHAVQDTPV